MFNQIPTPHNTAAKDDFAKTVLMPGDPLRSEYIAKKYLTNAVLVNNVRDIRGYTGEYKGKRISVMSSGMGVPSMGIYSHELYNLYDVDNIIRIGSCGSISKEVKVRDIVISQAVSTNSNYANSFKFPGSLAPTGNFNLIKLASELAKTMNLETHIGPTMCCDEFYHNDEDLQKYNEMGMLALEMETLALYLNAMRAKKKALAMFTVVDSVLHKDAFLTAKEREETLDQMILLALETAINIQD